VNILLLAALGAVVVGFVLHPIFGRGQQYAESLDEVGRERKRLEDQKNRLLATIKDLDFEYRAGKLSDADYQRVRADDLSQLTQVMARLEELTSGRKPTSAAAKQPKSKGPSQSDPQVTCVSCQEANPPGAKFCISCGKPIDIPVECPRCGAELPEKARFCANCGTAVQSE
jgi:hypothetical protein